MTEFWEKAFQEKHEMWSAEPARSAVVANDFFMANGIKNILIPGIGYGRNARLFLESGMSVSGIEISKTAIDLAQKHFGNDLKIYHGSVTDMPFDEKLYDGIFCYALVHLLDRQERIKLITDCYNQLSEKGVMIFTTITKEAPTYGKGVPIGTDRFEMFGGVQMFFYDLETLREEFGESGLLTIEEVTENYPFYLIKCVKKQVVA